MERNYQDVISGAVLLVLSFVMYLASLNMEALTGSRIGADFMPKIIALLIAIMSISVMINGMMKKNRTIENELEPTVDNEEESKPHESSDTSVEEEPENSYINLLFTILLLIVYLYLIPVIGFLIATIIYLIIQMLLFSEWGIKQLFVYTGVSIITSVVVYFVFRNVFYVMLPAGIFG